MKNGLGNLSAADVDQLTAIIKNRFKSIQYWPALIDAFLAQTRAQPRTRTPVDLSLSTSCNRCRQPPLGRVKTGLHRSSITAQQLTVS
jgi:hypothetical protein